MPGKNPRNNSPRPLPVLVFDDGGISRQRYTAFIPTPNETGLYTVMVTDGRSPLVFETTLPAGQVNGYLPAHCKKLSKAKWPGMIKRFAG